MLRRDIGIDELLNLDQDEFVKYHETTYIEYKEQFNRSGLSKHVKDFAGFANNVGGYLIFGVADSTWERIGLSEKSLEHWESTDPQYITGELNKLFNKEIIWESGKVYLQKKAFCYFAIKKAKVKPIIAKADEEPIRKGEIYYRYTARTQRIEPGDLELIIDERIEKNNNDWKNLISNIATIGPDRAVLLDTQAEVLQHRGSNFIIDENLIEQIRFFSEVDEDNDEIIGGIKLIGSIAPIATDHLEVASLIEAYPLDYKQLVATIVGIDPRIRQGDINKIKKYYKMKTNPEYSSYNFRSMKHRLHYETTGEVPSGTPSIYNMKAVEFIIKKFNSPE